MANEIEQVKKNSTFSDISEFAKNMDPIEFHSNKCKFCCSEFRHLAEKEYEKISNNTGAISAIHKFLTSRGEVISLSAVKNHLLFHFGKQVFEERLKEYGEEIEKWKNIRPSKEHRLQEFIDILYRRIYIIESNSESIDQREKAKNAEIIVKLIDQVNKCQAEIDKNQKQTEMIKFFIQRFCEIVKDHMENTPSREATKILGETLVSILDEANKIVGDLFNNE